MFPRTYFAGRYFAPLFFPGGGGGAGEPDVVFVICVTGADRRVLAVTGADRRVITVQGYTGGPGCQNQPRRAGMIATDEDLAITQGQNAVLKVKLPEATTGTNWLLTVVQNPNYVADVALPDFLMETKEFDTTDWDAVFASSTTDATLHDPAGAVVAMVIDDADADLLRGAGPGRFVIDVWCTDNGAERPVYGPYWLPVLPAARRP